MHRVQSTSISVAVPFFSQTFSANSWLLLGAQEFLVSRMFLSRLVAMLLFTDMALAVRDAVSLGDFPECSAWDKNLPDKWKAKAGWTTQKRKTYMDNNPDPCGEYGLKCCKGKCLLEGCKVVNCKKCQSKLKTVPGPVQKEICQNTEICHDPLPMDKVRGCAFSVGRCQSAKHSCEKCNLFHPVDDLTPLGDLSKAAETCRDTSLCYYPGDKHEYADGWCEWNRRTLKCENGKRVKGR